MFMGFVEYCETEAVSVFVLFYRLAHHHQAVQFRRTQIRGSDSSEDEFDEADDMEWGPATEL